MLHNCFLLRKCSRRLCKQLLLTHCVSSTPCHSYAVLNFQAFVANLSTPSFAKIYTHDVLNVVDHAWTSLSTAGMVLPSWWCVAKSCYCEWACKHILQTIKSQLEVAWPKLEEWYDSRMLKEKVCLINQVWCTFRPPDKDGCSTCRNHVGRCLQSLGMTTYPMVLCSVNNLTKHHVCALKLLWTQASVLLLHKYVIYSVTCTAPLR